MINGTVYITPESEPLWIQLAMIPTNPYTVSRSCLAFLARPDSDAGALGRARVVSRGEVLFSLQYEKRVPVPSVYS